MTLADRLKEMLGKAEQTAAEHKDQIHQAVEKAEQTADLKTGGKYHEQIAKAGAKVETYVENVKPTASGAPETEPSSEPPATQPPAHEGSDGESGSRPG